MKTLKHFAQRIFYRPTTNPFLLTNEYFDISMRELTSYDKKNYTPGNEEHSENCMTLCWICMFSSLELSSFVFFARPMIVLFSSLSGVKYDICPVKQKGRQTSHQGEKGCPFTTAITKNKQTKIQKQQQQQQ